MMQKKKLGPFFEFWMCCYDDLLSHAKARLLAGAAVEGSAEDSGREGSHSRTHDRHSW